MANLTAKFQLVDEMSEKLGSMAESGQQMIEQWESAGEAANAAFEGIAGAVTTATSTVDGVATSIDSLQEASDNAASSADTLAETMNGYGDAAGEAAAQTDYWTDAVGNYDKSALEAVYTTEELVEMGLKSAAALEEQEQMFELCEQSASSLSKSIEATAEIENELSAAMEAAAQATAELTNNEDVSAETKAALAKASIEAAEAMNELTAAQQEAEAAMAAYDEVMTSGTTDLTELEGAAERACHAAENLAEANGKASDATEELAKATEQAQEEAENAGKSGTDAVEGIAGALAAAGITAMVKEIAEAVYDLADAFSEAESIVVKATGASGEALEGLTTSMMNAYAAAKSGSLEDTAGAVGEINTRMGLTGETLTTVTGQFLDFAEITGTNVVSSVQSVTKIMNKWDVAAEDVESVLDKLAYAGQISGISVDSLASIVTNSSATFQALGMDLDNAISLLADLELYGTSSTTTVTGLRTAVNNFTDDGLDAEAALRSVINEIANMEDASEATALAVDTFGSRAGQELAGAIRSGAISVDTLTGSLEIAEGTLKSTAETAQTLDQKWTQASNNIKTAFTSALQPTIDGISSGLAGVVNSVGKFLNQHPTVTKAISAIGVGLGVVVVGIGGVAAASLTAIPAVAALGTAINAAIWPLTAVAAAIAAVTAAVLILKGHYDDVYDETMSMTAVTAAQTSELEELQAEYERACDTYGETSEEASRLKYQIDDLSATIAQNGQSMDEWCAEMDAVITSHDELMRELDETNEKVKDSELENLALIAKLEDLASQTDKTGATQTEMEAILNQLNGTVDGLSMSYEDLIENSEASIQTIRQAAEAQAEQDRQNALMEEYIQLIGQAAEEEEALASANDEVAAATDRASEASRALTNSHKNAQGKLSGWKMFWSFLSDEQAANDAAQDALQEATSRQEELQGALDETQARIAEIEAEWEGVGDTAAEAADGTITYEEAVATAYEGVRAEVEELCAAYDEAYEAALASFEGQFGLFDEASTKSEEYMNATVENAQEALDSQLAYWESYNANLETLTAYGEGLTGEARENYEALLQYASDGSEEAAGLAASMAEAIENGDTEAVEKLSQTVADVAAAQEEAAATTADFVTDFTAQMDALEQEMQSTVQELNLSDEAAASASATITSYADQIRAGKSGAVAAAQEVASAVSAALASANTTVNVKVNSSGSVSGHANGTTNAESVFVAGEEGPELVARPAAAYANGTTDSTDYFIAGENGPELIVGEQGSTVFPTEETDRLISALNDKEQPLQVFADTGGNSGKESTSEQVKRILLEVAGSGAIEVGGSGGADKETILEILTEHLKPVLMSIIQSEIYEEGELSYEY